MNDDLLHFCPSAKLSVAKLFKIRQLQKPVLQKAFKSWPLSTTINAAKINTTLIKAVKVTLYIADQNKQFATNLVFACFNIFVSPYSL